MVIRIIARGGSIGTAESYTNDVVNFCRWLNLTPDEAITAKYDWQALVNEYLDYIFAERKLAPAAGPRMYAGIKKWLDINDVVSHLDPAWGKVQVTKITRVEQDQ